MPKTRMQLAASRRGARATGTLMVRIDKEGKAYLAQAAALRKISVSDYVREVLVAQARREVQAAGRQVLSLTPEEQLEFWNALNAEPRLTSGQRRLGAVMRGDR
ncbi:MAG: type II toxin -antitoxin system TacA 1-like antitoxin [Planctomycetaceae bacterium]